MKKLISLLLVMMLVTFTGCAGSASKEAATTEPEVTEEAPVELLGGSIILSTTTSTENSGLLDYILPDFTEKTGTKVKVVAVGTGKALQMGKDGEADVLLVHAKSSEEAFVAEGHGIERVDVMYNDFVVIGSKEDPADLKAANSNVVEGFAKIQSTLAKFVSRGDDSGTNKKEIALWKEADIQPEGDWYISAGKGMGDVIQMADELNAYTLTDRATYLSMKENLDIEIVLEGDSKLFNQYGVIAVNPDKNDKINKQGADAFIKWLLSAETQELISGFGVKKFGQSLFTPNAK